MEGRDVWWHEIVRDQSTECPAEPMDAEDMLFVLYTSGSTGKPKGIIHTTGGYLIGVYLTTKYVFDIKPDESTGAPPTSAGSRATAMWSMARWPTARPR